MIFKRLLIVQLLVLLMSKTALATNTCNFEPSKVDKEQLKLVGKAQFSVLFWDIYQSWLYTDSGKYQANTDNTLFEIQYQKDITQQDLIERTVEQWQHLGIKEKTYQPYLALLTKLWPDIKSGDSLALWLRDNHSEFYFNCRYLGRVQGSQFGPLFLAIWLSPDTSQPKLRKRLLGAK